MEHDEKILGYIANNENISQRKLAKLTDLSLGHMNLLLHKLVNKGLLKIEKVNPSSLRYILTPQGIARNAKRTLMSSGWIIWTSGTFRNKDDIGDIPQQG